VKAPFDVPVTLKTGANSVVVVAREGAEIMSREILGIYRSDPNSMAERGLPRRTRNSVRNCLT